jgi:protein transport protein SEC9
MFAVHVSNPFTSKSRAAARDQAIMDTHHRERAERDATRSAAWSSSARQAETQRNLAGSGKPGGNKSSLADRAKYQFEA